MVEAGEAHPDGKARSVKPRGPRLTEGEIVAAALQIIKDDGVDGLSMRKLSRALNKSAMATYHYVPDKQALLDLVAAAALRDIVIPDRASGDWDVRLRRLIGRIDRQLRSHPGIGEILLDRMLSTHRDVLNATMDILVDAGFDGADVLMAYATVHTYLFGRYQVASSTMPIVNDDVTDTVARLLPNLPALSGRDFFEFGVDTLIDGLQRRLDRKRRYGQ